jgi:hypothetical protein
VAPKTSDVGTKTAKPRPNSQNATIEPEPTEQPSAKLVPLQFRMPPEFVRQFKQTALDHDLKLNKLLETCFREFLSRR